MQPRTSVCPRNSRQPATSARGRRTRWCAAAHLNCGRSRVRAPTSGLSPSHGGVRGGGRRASWPRRGDCHWRAFRDRVVPNLEQDRLRKPPALTHGGDHLVPVRHASCLPSGGRKPTDAPLSTASISRPVSWSIFLSASSGVKEAIMSLVKRNTAATLRNTFLVTFWLPCQAPLIISSNRYLRRGHIEKTDEWADTAREVTCLPLRGIIVALRPRRWRLRPDA